MEGERKFSAGLLAIIVHVLFFALLVVGVSWQSKRPQPVTAELWNTLPPPPPKPEVKPPPAPKVEPKPEPKPDPKPEPKPEPKPKIDPEILLKEKEEKRKKEELKRQEELKQKELERRKLEEEKKQKAEAEKRKLEEEKRLKAEEEKRKREEEQKRLAEEKRREEEKRVAEEKERTEQQLAAMREAEAEREAARQTAQTKLLNDQIEKIRGKIKRNIIMPPGIQGNPQAEFNVTLLPGGEVLSVSLTRASGNAAYDSAVERAIYKAQPLPLPDDPQLFSQFRVLDLRFRPFE